MRLVVRFQPVRFENMAGMLPYDHMCPRRRMHWLLVLLALIGAAACRRGASIAQAPGAATGPIDRYRPLPDPLPSIAARVDGQPIPTTRVAILARQRSDRGNLKDGPDAGVLREVLQQLIVRELLFQEALRRGLSADARALDRAYDELRATEPDDEHWRQRLAREGTSAHDIKQELRVQATVAELIASLRRRTPDQIEEDEARAYMKTHAELGHIPKRWRASQILLKAGPNSTPDERRSLLARADALRARLKAGTNFEALVREVSDDPRASEAGGAMSNLTQGTLDPAFEKALEPLQPGDISQVVTSSLGVHILKLHEVLLPEDLPYEAVADKVREAVVAGEAKQALDELIQRLEARARIEVLL